MNGQGLVRFNVYALATAVPGAQFRYFVVWGFGDLKRSAGPRKRVDMSCKPLVTELLGIPLNLHLLVFKGTVPETEFENLRAEQFQRIRWSAKDPWLAMARQLPAGLRGTEAVEKPQEAEVVSIYSSDEIRDRPGKRPVGRARARVKG